MKYLMTEGLLTEDFDRFVEAHDTGNDFVDEYSLRDFAESFGEYTAQQAAERGLVNFHSKCKMVRRSFGVLQQSIPVPSSSRGPFSADCLYGIFPS